MSSYEADRQKQGSHDQQLGCSLVPYHLNYEQKFRGSALFVDDSIKVDPLATSARQEPPTGIAYRFQRFSNSGAYRSTHPQDGRMSHSYAAFRHHLEEVKRAELECQIPPHAQDDDLLVKMPSLEEILC